MPAWMAGTQVRKDASGDIHVNLIHYESNGKSRNVQAWPKKNGSRRRDSYGKH